jgi:hypothetical protein
MNTQYLVFKDIVLVNLGLDLLEDNTLNGFQQRKISLPGTQCPSMTVSKRWSWSWSRCEIRSISWPRLSHEY